jgi:hypothetical protein
MTEVRTKVKPITTDIAIRNFIEEIILLTFLIKDQIDSSIWLAATISRYDLDIGPCSTGWSNHCGLAFQNDLPS